MATSRSATDRPGHPPVPAEVHIADVVVAKVAAHHASRVSGVAGLRPGLVRAVANRTARLATGATDEAGPAEGISTDGVTVEVTDDTIAHVTVDVAVHLGSSCLEVAKTIQRTLDAEILALTGLRSIVTVNVVDVLAAGGEEPETIET